MTWEASDESRFGTQCQTKGWVNYEDDSSSAVWQSVVPEESEVQVRGLPLALLKPF